MVRVLVVDDDAATAEFARMVLSDVGYQVTIFSDGTSALEWLGQFQPDVILLDMSMPRMSGREFLRAYRAISAPRPPVIAVSAERRFAYLYGVGALEVDDFLLKPFNLPELVDCVKKHVLPANSGE
jgi:DNA-binding response OmpR family regulator